MPIVHAKLLLPYRLQLPETVPIRVTAQGEIGVLVLTLEDYTVPRTEEQGRSSGIDDGRGTFLKSKVTVEFGPNVPMPTGENWDRHYAMAARDATNTLIDAYRIVTQHVFAHRIGHLEEWDVQPVGELGTGEPQRLSIHVWENPGGIQMMRTYGPDAVQSIQGILDGRRRFSLERLLLLDAERFGRDGDVNHAILNTAVALEVFIQRVLGTSYVNRFYSAWDTDLLAKYGHSLYEAVFFDEQFNRIAAFEILEFIPATRNAIVHEGEAVFRIRHFGRRQSRFLERHREWDGQRVPQQQALSLVNCAREIMRWVEDLLPQEASQRG